MKSYEFSLVFFTVFSQLAVGLAVFAAWQAKRLGKAGGPAIWGYITLLIGAALVSSLFHLGHPLRAYTTLANLGTAWLSAEILLGSLFAGLAVLAFITKGGLAVCTAAAVCGVVFIAVQGFTYAPLAQPALSNGLPLALFALTTWTLGAAGYQVLYASAPQQGPNVPTILKTGLWMWLALMLVVPCVWAVGGTIMRQTAISWVYSGLYWGAVLITVATLILLSKRPQQHPAPVVAALLVAAICGRLLFFGETASTFTNIGAPF